MEKPWTIQYDPKMKETLTYPDKTMYEMLARTESNFPHTSAVSFEGRKISFRSLLFQIDAAALALTELGLRTGDVATICLPNIPQAVIFFYAVNKLGVIANMVHPKTPPFELKEFMTSTRSEYLIIFNAFLPKHIKMLSQIPIKHIITAAIDDYLSPAKSVGFFLTKGRKIPKNPRDRKYLTWHDLQKIGLSARYASESLASSFRYQRPLEPGAPAVYLHSGGTTGTPKTIVLSSLNLNVLAVQGPQIVNIPDPFETGLPPDVSMVTILPLFHGFGLCMGMHTMMCNAITSILVPVFTPDSLAKVILKQRPSFIAAVPTLYEGILKSTLLEKADLSFLRCCFCGGDSLSADLKDRFESFIQSRGSKISLREGYGLTETVTVCCVNPEVKCKRESVGLPLPDMNMKIIEPNTRTEIAPGMQGEICVTGPTVMLGYLGDPEGTAEAVQLHDDGLLWVHTGDYGFMDEEGFFHFTQRLKRIIKVSGIPVFPSQIEAVISRVAGVDAVCVIAAPDHYRMHVVKAIVVASGKKSEIDLNKVKEDIIAACIEQLIPYARPAAIEFRDSLPETLVGKIDYVTLEKEESERSAAALE